jgi:hypothetical protein
MTSSQALVNDQVRFVSQVGSGLIAVDLSIAWTIYDISEMDFAVH